MVTQILVPWKTDFLSLGGGWTPEGLGFSECCVSHYAPFRTMVGKIRLRVTEASNRSGGRRVACTEPRQKGRWGERNKQGGKEKLMEPVSRPTNEDCRLHKDAGWSSFCILCAQHSVWCDADKLYGYMLSKWKAFHRVIIIIIFFTRVIKTLIDWIRSIRNKCWKEVRGWYTFRIKCIRLNHIKL